MNLRVKTRRALLSLLLSLVTGLALLSGGAIASTFDTSPLTGTAGNALSTDSGNWTKNSASTGGTDVAYNTTGTGVRAANTTNGNVMYYMSGSPATQDYFVQAHVKNLGGATNGFASLAIRYSTGALTGYELRYAYSTSTIEFLRSNATVIGSSTAFSFPVGQDHTISITASGTTTTVLTFKYDGNVVMQATDSSSPVTTSGKAGIMFNGLGSGGSPDVGLQFSNFSAADIPGAATGFQVTGPTSGPITGASATWTATYNGSLGSSHTLTLSDGGAGGTFSTGTSVTVGSATTPFATWTYTPPGAGTFTISWTDSSSLTPSPTSIVYTATLIFVQDSLSDASGTSLSAHVPLIGAAWNKNTASTSAYDLIASTSPSGYFRTSSSTNATLAYYNSVSPTSADYDQTIFFLYQGSATNGYFSDDVRMSTGSLTYYGARAAFSSTGVSLSFDKSNTIVGASYPQVLTPGSVHSITISVRGTTTPIETLYFDHSFIATITDSTSVISAAGHPGLSMNSLSNGGSDTTGALLYNEQANYPLLATAYFVTESATGGVAGSSVTLTVTPNGYTSGSITFTPNDHSAGGVFAPTSQTVAASQNPTTSFVYTPPSVAGTYDIAWSSGAALTDAADTIFKIYKALAYNDASIVYSPDNWDTISSDKISITTGADLYEGSTGTAFLLGVDVSALVSASVAAADYPVIQWSVDGGPLTAYQLKSTDSLLPLTITLASGSHVLHVLYDAKGGGANANCWNGTDALRISGLYVDPGTTQTAPTLPTPVVSVDGDSILEGRWNGSGPGVTASALTTWIREFVSSIGARLEVHAFGGMGWTTWINTATGGVPFYTPGTDSLSSWNKIRSGVSRSFTTPPTYEIVCLGTNDQSASDAAVEASIDGWLTDFRAQCPNTPIFVLVPPGGYKRSAITTAVATQNDPHVFLIDVGNVTGLTGTASEVSQDGTHPNPEGHKRLLSLYQKPLMSFITKLPPASGQYGRTR